MTSLGDRICAAMSFWPVRPSKFLSLQRVARISARGLPPRRKGGHQARRHPYIGIAEVVYHGSQPMQTIVGLFESRSAAEDAIRRLQAAGFSRDAIGIA